ncbi:general transcription factor 3C polypeptide 5 [Histomonas meleagridis]|uniref:general transcription factor 3C polypeptide 5 n=1 Tax=Histomonas meleagridis TaxID=135588 RepID=UPI00355A18EA|nr:general transcription factor 3C polypeptide 5 [Histomonas meleagridis]KAH0796832.1 general transcription factor 3C polypeptide 5 [Histomonas meleagridis]
MSHKIESEQLVDPCILIRINAVRRFVIRNGEKILIDTELIPEYLGKSIQTNKFTSPSDFQFLPPLASTLNEPTVECPPPQSFLYLPPPIFVHNYHYTAQYIQRRLFNSKQRETSKMWRGDCTWIVNQNDLHAMINGPPPPNPLPEYIPEFVEIFKELFDIRPIWTINSLFDQLNQNHETRGNILEFNEQNPQIFHSLAVIAYHIKDGPFQMCWVRYGINPLMTNSYCMLQSIILSLRNWDYAQELIKRTNRGNKYVSKKIKNLPLNASKANALPDRLFYAYQLCDLNEPLITEELAHQSDSFSFSFGWFKQQSIENIRKFITLKLQRIMLDKKAISPTIIMSDITSWDMVQKELDNNKPKIAQEEDFDFELLNQAQSILEIFDVNGKETIDDYIELMTVKTCNISLERIFSY